MTTEVEAGCVVAVLLAAIAVWPGPRASVRSQDLRSGWGDDGRRRGAGGGSREKTRAATDGGRRTGRLFTLQRRPRPVPSEVAELVEALGPALAAGLDPARALRETVLTLTSRPLAAVVEEAGSAAAAGGSAGVVFMDAGDRLGLHELVALGRIWVLAEESGVSMGSSVTVVGHQVRAAETAAQQLAAGAAGARASARILMTLPLAGPLVGLTFGLDPVRLYASSPLALFALVLGAGLASAGAVWSRLLLRRALRPTPLASVDGHPSEPATERRARLDAAGRAAVTAPVVALTGHPSARLELGDPAALLLVLVVAAVLAWPPHRPARAQTTDPRGNPAGPRAPTVVRTAPVDQAPARRQAPRAGSGHLIPHGAVGRPVRGRLVDVAEAMALLCVVLQSGAGQLQALDRVERVMSEPVAGHLRSVAAALRWGLTPEEAWRCVPAVWAPASRAWSLAATTGSALAASLDSAATRLRESEARRVEGAVARAGTLLVLPLGLCFLPAFACTTVIPVVLALVGDVVR